MSLKESQRKHLRGLGHTLKPLVQVASGGLSKNVMIELERTLEHHELIKVRVRNGDRKERDALIADLTEKTRAQLIQRVGNVALIYRAAEEPRIALPTAR